MTRIVVAEDHVLIRESVVRLLSLEADLEVVAEAGRGDDALAAIEEQDPDLALLDISMPGMDGLAVALELRRRPSPVPVVFLTMHQDELTVRRAVQVGARGYVLKSDAAADLLETIRVVVAGGRLFTSAVTVLAPGRPPASAPTSSAAGSRWVQLADDWSESSLASFLEDRIAEDRPMSPAEREHALAIVQARQDRSRARRAPFQLLSPSEQDVLAALMEGRSAELIASDRVVSVATIRSQIRSILLKLEVRSQLEAVALAYRCGWAIESARSG